MESARLRVGFGPLGWLGLWTALGMLAAVHHRAYHEVSWETALWWGLKDWYLWGLLALVILRMAGPLARRYDWPRLVVIHVVLAVVFAVFHATVAVSLSMVFESVGGNAGWGQAVIAHVLKKAPLNLAVYFAIAGASYALGLGRTSASNSHDSSAEPPDEPAERLLVRTRDGEAFVDVDRIDRVEATGNYVTIRAGDERWLERRTLASVEKLLGGRRFMRIHRSHLVNVGRVARIESGFKGRSEVVLEDGTRLPMGRTYRRALKERVGRNL